MVVLVPRAPIPLTCAVKVILVSHSEEITVNEKPHKNTEFIFLEREWELWKMESVKVVPNIIRAPGTIPKRMEEYLRNINAQIVGKTRKKKAREKLAGREKGKSFLPFYFRVCAFPIQRTRLSRSLQQARIELAAFQRTVFLGSAK